jgi:hypothetical protein
VLAQGRRWSMPIQVHLFRSTGRIFGVTGDASGANLPAQLQPWAAFKSIEIARGTPTPGLHADECLDDIAAHGFHVTDAHVRITGKYV